MGTHDHNPDFHVLVQCYMEILHMGDHVVSVVGAWYKLTWRFAHRHLLFKILIPRVPRDLSICVDYDNYFMFTYLLYSLEMVRKKRPTRPVIVGDWYAYLR